MSRHCPNCGRAGAYDTRFYQCVHCCDRDIIDGATALRSKRRSAEVLAKLKSMVDPNFGLRERLAQAKWEASVRELRAIPGLAEHAVEYILVKAKRFGVTTVRSRQEVLDDWLESHRKVQALKLGIKP